MNEQERKRREIKGRIQEVLEATIFGKFSLTNGTATLGEDDIQANKLIHLLVYMISRRNTIATREQLTEQFCSENLKNPENAMKNLIYRLRRMLTVLGPEEYICTRQRGYQWNPRIPVRTDYEELEKLSRKIKEQPDNEVRKKLCRKVINGCRGDISIKLACETWLQPQVIHCRMRFLEVTKTLCGIYEQENEWEELEKLCQKIVEKEPLEEDIWYWLIKSLQKQKKYDQALYHYESVKNQFYENLGIGTPKKLQEIFQDVVTDSGIQLTSIVSIKQEAGEKKKPEGAFFCDYQIFRQIYRLEKRRIGRMGISEYLLLLTIRRTGNLWGGGVAADTGTIEGVSILEKILRDTLRMGDVVTRNSPTQFLILLSSCSYEAGIVVAKRIQKNFLKKVKHLKMELEYELEELSF